MVSYIAHSFFLSESLTSFLSSAKKTNLQVKEDKTRGLYVQDVTEVYVQNPEEMYQVMRSGQ